MTENLAGRGEGLAGLRELLAKATPQPWNKFISNWDDRLNGYTIPGAVVRGTEAEDCPPDLQAAIFSTTGPRAHADAELIVAAVNYVRAALEAAAPPSTGPHTFTGSDGTGKCCSCGWLCAGGLRNTCEAEWETHVAMAALATPSPQTPRKCSCDPETGRRDPDCKVCAATQEQPAGSAMDGIRRRLQEFAGRLHRPGCPLRLALSDDFVKGWDAAKAHCAERIESILRNYPDGGSPRKVSEDGAKGRQQMSSGVSRIANERLRQIAVERWTPEHDRLHDEGQLAIAAACYASPIPLKGRMYVPVPTNCGCREADCPHEPMFGEQKEVWRDPWPWEASWDKRKKHNRIRQLEIAGALIAAEIDRLLRPSSVPVGEQKSKESR